jgi:glycosyltransferase involved in cell wall biosynthesis
VLLDTTYARRGPSGTGVYIERLAPALRALGIEVVEAANERRRPRGGGGLASVRNALGDRWWTAVELPRQARSARADVIHHPLPAIARRAPCPQVIAVHDLAFEALPEHFDPRFRAFARRAHRAAARRAAAVICVSHATARDAMGRWGVPSERIVVAHHGPGQELHVERAGPEHFLYVGDSEPRKNLGLLLDAYRLYRAAVGVPLGLVLAGSAVVEPEPGVRVVTGPDAAELSRLHVNAAALVHPALHEGFGLTPLEAMAAGTPVIAARSAAVEEVCGDAARYVDADDRRALAAELAAVAADERARAELTEKGRERAAAFTWEASARAHVEAYTLALR